MSMNKKEYLIQVNGLDANQALQKILQFESIPFTVAVGAGGPVICIAAKDRASVNIAIAEWKWALDKIKGPV